MLKSCFLGGRQSRQRVVLGLMFCCAAPALATGQPSPVWTLENSIQRAIEVAPETQAAQAAIAARVRCLAAGRGLAEPADRSARR